MICRSAGFQPAFISGGEDAGWKPALRHILFLPPSVCDHLATEARAAYPRECCGLIEGIRRGDVIEALRLHPTRNLAVEFDRFEIDPAEHFRLLRGLRGTGREIVGCYHSHPNGAAVPSPRDRDMASEENFVWLIAAIDKLAIAEIGAYLFADGEFQSLWKAL